MTTTVNLETGARVALAYRGLQPRALLIGHPVLNLERRLSFQARPRPGSR